MGVYRDTFEALSPPLEALRYGILLPVLVLLLEGLRSCNCTSSYVPSASASGVPRTLRYAEARFEEPPLGEPRLPLLPWKGSDGEDVDGFVTMRVSLSS